jgi:pimeloyl-ACP methyl ester carboxylesterase
VVLWPFWDQIRHPVLVLRGKESDLLTPETAHEMTVRGPKAGLVEIPGTGHAPMLMADDQIDVVREFLAT